MGYDVHITRASDWSEARSAPITLEEWQAYLASDGEMRLDGFAEAPTPSGVPRIEASGLAVWTAWPQHERGEDKAWFAHHSGCVTVKNPDDAILAKMCEIARRLGARVQGDDGEYYSAPPSDSEQTS